MKISIFIEKSSEGHFPSKEPIWTKDLTLTATNFAASSLNPWGDPISNGFEGG